MRASLLYVLMATAMAASSGVGRAQSMEQLDRAPRMTQAEFKKLLAEDKIFVIDVRSYSTYLLGHIPGARSFPLEDLGLHVDEFKAVKKPIVAYCA
jgi:3-mercaptopyruvate sulfurtransferase SseA